MTDDDDILISSSDNDDDPHCEEFAFERVMRALLERDKQDRDLVMQSRFSDLHGSIQAMDMKVGLVGERVDLANSRIGQIETRFDRVEGCMDTIVAHYHDQATKQAAMDSQLATMNKTLSDEHKSLNQLEQEQQAMRCEYNGDLQSLNKTVGEVKETLSTNGETMKGLAADVSSLAGKAGVLHTRFEMTWKAIMLGISALVFILSGLVVAGTWAAKHFHLIPALLLVLAGCTSSSLKTKTPLNVESKYRVGPMVQACGHADELIPLIEQAYPIVLEEMERVGVITDRAKLEESLRGSFWKGSTRGCLVEEPDSCSELKPGCVGDPRCARRRECAMAWGKYFWVARWWPPICRGEWPVEPNCVPVGSPARESNYRGHIVVGLANLLYQASGHTDNFHFAPKVLAAIAATNKRLGW